MKSTTERDHESLIHSLDGKYCCGQCTRNFANPSDLEYHLGAKHRTNPETKLDYGECGKTSKNDETLRLSLAALGTKNSVKI